VYAGVQSYENYRENLMTKIKRIIAMLS
jgi:hypothetical protein